MISVCIPTYNGEKYIREQLVSILQQSRAVDEIIISDDSSTDNTLKLISEIDDSRIKVFANQHFSSPIFNLENALKQAKGDYIFLADQDDIWEKNKVELLVKKIKSSKLVVSDGIIIDESGQTISPSIFELFMSKRGFLKNWIKSSYMGCCMAFHKSLLDIVLPFPKSIAMHDLWIGLNAEIYTTPHFYPEKLIRYRRHSANETPLNAQSNNNSIFYKLRFRFNMLWLILIRFVRIKIKSKKLKKVDAE